MPSSATEKSNTSLKSKLDKLSHFEEHTKSWTNGANKKVMFEK